MPWPRGHGRRHHAFTSADAPGRLVVVAICRKRNYLMVHRSWCYGRSMTLDDFVICFEHASAHAQTTLLAKGTVHPLFTIVDRRGHARPVAADFTSEAAKKMSFAIVHAMCVAEAAIAVFHCAEAWAVLDGVAPNAISLQGGRRIEILLVAGTARVDGRLAQRLSMRGIERSLLGAVSGLRDIPVSALGGVDAQHLPLQGRVMGLLPAKPPTFVDRWRARGRVGQMAKRLACGRPTFAR